MKNFNIILDYFQNYTTERIIEVIIAIGIAIIFILLSSGISYTITKILRKKLKKSEIKKSSLYIIIKFYISIIGIFVAIILAKDDLLLSIKLYILILKIFKIISIYMIARIICECITLDLLKKFSTNHQKDGISNFILKIIRFVVYAFTLFIIILELGYDLSGLITGLGISSIVITLAAQNIAKDILGGIVILTDKPFKIGDWIQFDNYEGNIEDISLRSTRIRTFENSVVNVPNATISNASIINCSRIEKRRFKFSIGLELDTPLETIKIVEDKIRNMLRKKESVLDDSVIVSFDTITDNAINLLIYAYTNSINYESFLRAKEDINFKIMYILNEEKVDLAYDTKTILLKK